MTVGNRRVVLDASAVIAWLFHDRGSDTVSKLLSVAVLPASAMTESLYRAREKGHHLSLSDLYSSIIQMGVTLEPITGADSLRAAELIGASRQAREKPEDACLSLGDGLCLAVAERLQLVVTGGDTHWETLDLNTKFQPFR